MPGEPAQSARDATEHRQPAQPAWLLLPHPRGQAQVGTTEKDTSAFLHLFHTLCSLLCLALILKGGSEIKLLIAIAAALTQPRLSTSPRKRLQTELQVMHAQSSKRLNPRRHCCSTLMLVCPRYRLQLLLVAQQLGALHEGNTRQDIPGRLTIRLQCAGEFYMNMLPQPLLIPSRFPASSYVPGGPVTT
jgi:hypothetical protein